MPNRQFSDRLNKELDKLGLPLLVAERIEAFSKLIKVPKFRAAALLGGQLIPEAQLLLLISQELEVDPDWLIGKQAHRRAEGFH